MINTIIGELFAYNRWANAKILDKAALLSREELEAENEFSHGNLHSLLFHMLRTEWIWRQLSQFGKFNDPAPHQEELTNLSDLRQAWEVEAERMESYLSGLAAEDLAARRDLRDPRGGKHSYTQWEMLVHLALHSMQHRSEAAAILTHFNQSPGDMDFIFFTMRGEK